MKVLLFPLILAAFSLGAADVWSSGGVASDWSKKETKPEKEIKSTVNYVKNGSFEMPGTDFNGKKGKGYWQWGARIHGKHEAPGAAEFKERYIKGTIRKINTKSATDGKCSLLIKSPDEMVKWISPLPMMSNRVVQSFNIPASQADQLYRITFKTKGYHKPTSPNRGLFLFQLRPMKLKGKQLLFADKGIQHYFSLKADWHTSSYDVRFPAGCTGANLTLCLYGVGEACVDDIRFFPVKNADSDPVQVKATPYAWLDNVFCLGENLPGVINFTLHADNRKFKRKKLLLEVDMPEGFQIVDTRNNCPAVKTGKNSWQIDLMETLPNTLARSWYAQHAISVMVKSSLPPSEKLYKCAYRLKDGSWQGKTSTVNFKVIPAVKGEQPQLFKCSAMLNNEWNFEKGGVKEIVDFYKTSGFNAIFGAKGPVSQEMKKAGFHRFLQSSMLANGFKIGADPKPDHAQFKMINGKHFAKHICPVEVYTRGPYYKEAVYNGMFKKLIAEEDTTDSFMPNWEPYYLDSKGCFCNRCRDEFIKYSKGTPSAAEIKAVWPADLFVKYSDEYFKFRSWQHGQVVLTLNHDIAEVGKSVGKKSLFIPEVSWKCMTYEHNRYCRQYNVTEYMRSLPWLEPWGPYIYHSADHAYNYFPTRHMIPYATAGMVRRFMDTESAKGPMPKIIAFPHAYQGSTWVTEPEALAFETLSYFARGYNGSFCYYFPRGYDYRHWQEMAKANTLIARHEKFTQLGKNDNKNITLTPVTPLPAKLYYSPGWEEPEGGTGAAPGLSKMAPLQFQAWHYKGEILICAGNFWQKGEIFFNLKIAGLAADKKYAVTTENAHCGIFTGSDLAKGILLQAGALRWRFITVGAPGKAENVFDQKMMKELLAKRLPGIKNAVAWEKAYADKVFSYAAADSQTDVKSLKSCSNAGVSVTPAGKFLQVVSKKYTLTLAPTQGGRIHNWRSGSDTLVTSRTKYGFAVPAIWYPANSAFVLRSGMKIENIGKTDDGVEVKLSRILTAKDQSDFGGMKLEMRYNFTKEQVTCVTTITNQLHDGVEFAFRYHNMLALLGKEGKQIGKLDFKSGEVFHRSFVQKFIRLSASDPLLEKAYKRTNLMSTAKELPVTVNAPWSKTGLEFTFSPRPHSIMIWDEERMDCSTFEPVFNRVMLAPGQSASFTISARISKEKR